MRLRPRSHFSVKVVFAETILKRNLGVQRKLALLVTWHFVNIFCASGSAQTLPNEFPGAGFSGLGFWLR
jgi:hypothetical protein